LPQDHAFGLQRLGAGRPNRQRAVGMTVRLWKRAGKAVRGRQVEVRVEVLWIAREHGFE
jgi:hypothetical protein